MSLFLRKNGTDNWNDVDAMLERMQLGIKVFERWVGRLKEKYGEE